MYGVFYNTVKAGTVCNSSLTGLVCRANVGISAAAGLFDRISIKSDTSPMS